MFDAALTRRGAMGTIAAAAAAGLVPLRAATLREGGFAIVEPALGEEARTAATRLRPGARTVLLGHDVVREWRDGLASKARGGVAVVQWGAAVMLAGLARESGIKTTQRQIGPSAFVIEFA